MTKQKDKTIKCKLKQCVMCEVGKCTHFIPTVIPKLTPNSVRCKFYEDDIIHEELINKLKNKSTEPKPKRKYTKRKKQ